MLGVACAFAGVITFFLKDTYPFDNWNVEWIFWAVSILFICGAVYFIKKA